MILYIQHVRAVLVLESGVELEWEQTKPGTAGCGYCCCWSCAPDGVFGSRLPRCSCLAMTQQPYSKMHIGRSPETQSRWLSFAALGAQRRRRCSAACCLIDGCPVLARVFFSVLAFQINAATQNCLSENTSPYTTKCYGGDLRHVCGHPIFWRCQNKKLASYS